MGDYNITVIVNAKTRYDALSILGRIVVATKQRTVMINNDTLGSLRTSGGKGTVITWHHAGAGNKGFAEVPDEEAHEKMELGYVECLNCGHHLGIDWTFIEQVREHTMFCPGCGQILSTYNVFRDTEVTGICRET